MNILLIDVDSKITNLALMQLSAYYKNKGDNIKLLKINPIQIKKQIIPYEIFENCDNIFVSCIFDKNKYYVNKIFAKLKNCEIGGSGINYNKLPEEMQKIKPDYDLYPSDVSQGFTTRGCIRNCPFCIVRKKEGEYQRWQHPKEFYDDRFDKIMIMDNNWMADRKWFFETSQWIIDNNIKLREGGLDIRLLDQELAEQLAKFKTYKPLKFAFDSVKDEDAIKNGIELLNSVGIDVRHNVLFYVLVGYNTNQEEDKYRCRLLKKLNTNAFVMPYVKNEWTKRIARWANRKQLYWSIDIDDFKG